MRVSQQPHLFPPLSVTLPYYNGPLEVLLELVRSHKMDIFTVSLADICDPFLEVVKNMHFENFENHCEFLDISSTLIFIKAKRVLPLENEEAESEDMETVEEQEENLRLKLIEYQSVKKQTAILEKMELLDREVFLSSASLEFSIGSKDILQKPPDLYSLVSEYKKLGKRRSYLMDYNIAKESETLESVMQKLIFEILGVLDSGKDGLYLGECETIRNAGKTVKSLHVLGFCSGLELAKMGMVRLTQKLDGSDVYIFALDAINQFRDIDGMKIIKYLKRD